MTLLLLFLWWRRYPLLEQDAGGPGHAFGQKAWPWLLLCVALEMGSYHLQNMLHQPSFEAAASHQAQVAGPLPYVASRAETPASESRAARLLKGMHAHTYGEKPMFQRNSLYTEILFSSLGEESCHKPQGMIHNYVTTPIHQMLEALFFGEFFRPQARPFLNKASLEAIGCDSPKLILTDRYRLAADSAEAGRMLQALAEPQREIILQGVGEATLARLQDAGEKRPAGNPSETRPLGTVRVVSFSANHLDMAVTVKGGDPVWLLYQDAYHPDWKGFVDGQSTPVVQANIGFKALLVEPGTHRVRFELQRGLAGLMGNIIYGVGLLTGLVWLLMIGWGLVRGLPGHTETDVGRCTV